MKADRRPERHVHADAEARARVCAGWLADILRTTQAAARGGRISFMVSGGRSPAVVLGYLADDATLDWDRIDVFASDERLVAVHDADSTEGMVRRVFADRGRDVRYHGPGPDPAPGPALAYWHRALKGCTWPAAAALLGIGEDAHVASVFPGRPDGASARDWAFTVPQTAPHPQARLSLAPRALELAGPVALIVAGRAKHAALARALDPAADPRAVPAAVLQRLERVAIFQDDGS